MSWYVLMWKNTFDYSGRSRRKEYWMVFLANIIIAIVLGIIGLLLLDDFEILFSIYGVISFLPQLSLGVRRLHDTGRSGWWLLIGLVPIVGAIVLLVFFLMDSQVGENKYGPNPKGIEEVTV